MSIRSVCRTSLLGALFSIFVFSAQAASAATLLVDDDGAQCPAATYTGIQPAIDAAMPGDTVVVCDGTYREGPGTPGSNGLTITKSLNIRGTGADRVTIQPTRSSPLGGQIAAASPVLRDGTGNIISVNGTPATPITVDISGVTVTGGGDKTYFDPNIPQPIWNGEFEHGVYSEAGVVYLDAGGSFLNNRVTNVVTSEAPGADIQAGGYRNGTLGWGLAQVTAASAPGPALPLAIKGSRFDRYNRGGILIDGATNDAPPLAASGNPQHATITRSTVVGRQLNSPPLDGSGGGPLLTTGTVFGQDGVRVTSGSTLALTSSDVYQNLPAGTGTNTIGQLNIASGLRFIDAGSSSAIKSNIEQNGYGIINVQADGSTANTGTPVAAGDDWWGLGQTSGIVNTGPGVSPVALPLKPNNPVNGATDVTWGSDAVHFLPFRSGNEADQNAHWPVAETPAPVTDQPPAVTLGSSVPKVAPGGNVVLTATATDDFGVKKLTFYRGNTLIGTVTPPANTVNWTAPVACGAPQTVQLTVFAEDSSGQESFADVSVDVDDCGPQVQLTAAPNSGGPLGSIKLSADANDDLGLASLKFYADGNLISTVNSPPNHAITTAVFTPPDPCGDSFSFEVVATDTTGHTANGTASFNQDDCVPTVTLHADHNSVAPGATVHLTADAEDDHEVASLRFFAGATQIGYYDTEDHSPVWNKTIDWTAPNQCGTSTVLKVVATDNVSQHSDATTTVVTTPCPDLPPTVSLSATPNPVAANGTVTLDATAGDDHGVTNLAFFADDSPIGSVTPPVHTTTWTAPPTCGGSVVLKVTARDTANQTTSATVTVNVACPSPPTVSIDSPPAKIAQNGTTVRATATGAAGITRVSFYLGSRLVCEDSSAPYSCLVRPRGSEVGASSVRAVVTDALDRTAEDIQPTTVNRFKPKDLTLKAKRIGKRKTRIKLTGKLVLPARVTAAQGCSASRVDILAKLGGRSLTNRQVALRGCGYSLAFAAPKTKRKQRVVIRVRFPGNGTLTAATRTRKVR